MIQLQEWYPKIWEAVAHHRECPELKALSQGELIEMIMQMVRSSNTAKSLDEVESAAPAAIHAQQNYADASHSSRETRAIVLERIRDVLAPVFGSVMGPVTFRESWSDGGDGRVHRESYSMISGFCLWNGREKKSRIVCGTSYWLIGIKPEDSGAGCSQLRFVTMHHDGGRNIVTHRLEFCTAHDVASAIRGDLLTDKVLPEVARRVSNAANLENVSEKIFEAEGKLLDWLGDG